MRIFFPQWQGSGYTDEIKVGAEIILQYYGESNFHKVPLSNIEVTEKNNIVGFDAIYEQLNQYKSLLNQTRPRHIFTVGGDCGLEIIPVSYLNDLYENDLAVLWLDAHADINTPHESPSHNFHGMPLRTLMGEGDKGFERLLSSKISSHQLFYAGLRLPDRAEESYIEKNKIYHTPDLSTVQLISTISERSFSNLYIHLDLDILEPKEYEHTKYQVRNGTQILQTNALLEDLDKKFNIVGASILESTAVNLEQLEPISKTLDILNGLMKH